MNGLFNRCLNDLLWGYCKGKPRLGKKVVVGETAYQAEVDTCKLGKDKCGCYVEAKDSFPDTHLLAKPIIKVVKGKIVKVKND